MNKEESYQENYQFLDAMVDRYFQEFTGSFQKREEGLINALEARANTIKASIQDLKKKTSQESIEKLISKRKQQNENERLRLEKGWREVTEKLKKFQAEDKKLTNQNKEAAFDIQNLVEKIEELELENEKLQKRSTRLQDTKKTQIFITEENLPYVSPYKFSKVSKTLTGYKKAKEDHNVRFMSHLRSVKYVQNLPQELLLNFLSRPEIKEQIYNMIK